ncbi:hypothetical protein Hanom_Chr01g00060861 [Helianthus anomalus]
MKEIGPSRIEIRNLTKDSSWTYEPIMFLLPEEDEFKNGDKVEVWLSHWMFGRNEFEDGDEVSIHFSVKYYFNDSGFSFMYDSRKPDYANVREYGISLMYDDGGGGGGNRNEDPLGYYKSWKHIIGRDLSAFEVSSTHYVLTPWVGNV